REEDWMVEETEVGANVVNPSKSFVSAVKGGRNPVAESNMEEDDEFSASEEDGLEEEDEEEIPNIENGSGNEKDHEQSQIPEIKVEKINGIYNFAFNEAAKKKIREPWWDTLIVKLLGRRITL
ncbi:hypothetical protein PIB30_015674, partial [Stylosanthes scabra]|nr:hypothetical protein [Stylosanthes scabra]